MDVYCNVYMHIHRAGFNLVWNFIVECRRKHSIDKIRMSLDLCQTAERG